MFTAETLPDFDRERLAAEHINHRKRAKTRSVGELVGYEVQTPDFIRRSRPNTCPPHDHHLAPLRQLRAKLKLFFSVNTVRLVLAEAPALALEQDVDTPIAIAHAYLREVAHPRAQVIAPILDAAVILGATRLLH